MASSDVNSKISAIKSSKDDLKSKRCLFMNFETVPEGDKADLCAVATNGTTKGIPKMKSVAVSRGKIPRATLKQIPDSKTFGFEAQSRRVAVEEPAINGNNFNGAAQSKENCERNVDLGKPGCSLKQRQLKPPSYSLKNASKKVTKLLQQRKMSQQSPDKSPPGSDHSPEKIIRGNCFTESSSSLDAQFSTLSHSELSALKEEWLTSTPLRAAPNTNQEIPIQVVSPRRYVDHAGLLFHPNSTKTTTAKPFNFDHKSKGKRRSKTAPAPDSPLLSKGKKSAMDDSKISARNGMMDSHIRRIKKPEVKKLLPLTEGQSADTKKTAVKEIPVATKITSHAGLTFKPKPLTKSNTFTIKPGESKILEELKRRNPQLCGNA